MTGRGPKVTHSIDIRLRWFFELGNIRLSVRVRPFGGREGVYRSCLL